ncbi:MAG: hypothetical protein U1C66_01560 [Patescibacteria group bacterium]|nr:hypothetical protein [Patescibacteria group bacterium]
MLYDPFVTYISGAVCAGTLAWMIVMIINAYEELRKYPPEK